MKTFKLIGMALLAIVMCVNFTACSDDDDDPMTNVNSLEGTWVLKEANGFEYDRDGKKEEFYEIFDINNPTDDDIRIRFTKLSENKYKCEELRYYQNNWDLAETEDNVKLENGYLYFSYGRSKIVKLNSKTLILFEEADPSHKFTEEITETYVKID